MQNEETIILKSFCGTYIIKVEGFKRNDLTYIKICVFNIFQGITYPSSED